MWSVIENKYCRKSITIAQWILKKRIYDGKGKIVKLVNKWNKLIIIRLIITIIKIKFLWLVINKYK